MKTTKTINSWNSQKNEDCFGNKGNPTIDHIYPIAQGGSDGKANQQYLSLKSNGLKGDETKGKINGIRFSVEPVSESESGYIVGQMFIKKNDEWIKVIPIR